MPAPVQKVIISNESRLNAKYGAALTTVIEPAIQALIAADGGRGISTVAMYLDNAAAMAPIGSVVTSATDEKQNKDAVDAIFKFYQPDYLMILGAGDVVPLQTLINPAYSPGGGDPDQIVPSDLPYACSGAYSPNQNINDYLTVTRAVGRLPDITNGTDPAVLQAALATAAGFSSRPVTVYQQYLGVSAEIWKGSTSLSLIGAFGNATNMQIVPPATYAWTAAQLAKPSHFFNCHGATMDPKYYGQPATGAALYPVADDAAYIAGKIVQGTVGAAECCYGAELYDPILAGGQCGIANQYLIDGAYGFLGSTNIAYGPATGNDNADVICRDFFSIMIGGASIGRSLLQARQNYVATRSTMSQIDSKTLAQFYLLGDPSVQPVSSASPLPHVMTLEGADYVASPAIKAGAFARSERRAGLELSGLMLADSVCLPGERLPPTNEIKAFLLSRMALLGAGDAAVQSRVIGLPRQRRVMEAVEGAKAMAKFPRAIHLAIGRLPTPPNINTPRLAGVEIMEYDGNRVEKQFFSR